MGTGLGDGVVFEEVSESLISCFEVDVYDVVGEESGS